jgi:Protein of unknown function (DUF3224)
MTSVISKARTIEQRILFFAVSLAIASCDGHEPHASKAMSSAVEGNSSGALQRDSESERARGNFTTRSTTTGVRQVDGILIVTQDITFTVTGDLSGTALAQDTVVINPATGTGFFFGSGTLTGTVLGRSGTIGFMFTGTFTGFPVLPRLRGHVVFFPESGTGQLRGLGGEGTLQGILDVGGTYSIEVEFGS